jgi:23S rRNA (uracil1939-C5)-methyltransferase
MISVGDVLPLTIDKPAAGGRMIARADGLVVLVSGAIPGERVRASIERVGKGVAYAAAVAIDEPSADRRAAGGDPLCGGCVYAHIAYPRQLEIKALVIADAFARIGHLTLPDAVPVAPSPHDGYRMRARLHVRGRKVGFFREGTHDVCEARQTRQLLPATVDAIDRFVAATVSLGIDGHCDLDVAENVDASQRVVALERAAPVDDHVLDRLAGTDGFTGVATRQGARGDAWVTDTLVVHGGPPVLVRRHVLAFFQGNRFLLAELVGHVMEHVPPGSDVIDLYAGVGLFSMAAAGMRGARVAAVEGDRIAAGDLAANARASNGAVVAFHQAVETFVAAGGRGRSAVRRVGPAPDHGSPMNQSGPTLIVDPPRTGMSREALNGVIAMRAPRIVYVSCDVATLARDARRLVESGYAMTQMRAFDLFPNTPHVETVTLFAR